MLFILIRCDLLLINKIKRKDAVAKRKIPSPRRESNPKTPAEAHPVSYPMGTRGSFPGGKAAEA
jgi:hypothetical protein